MNKSNDSNYHQMELSEILTKNVMDQITIPAAREGKITYMPQKTGVQVVRIRLEKAEYLSGDTSLDSPEDVAQFAAEHFGDMDREYFLVFNLDKRCRAINMSVCSIGTIDMAVADPKSVFKAALLSNASYVVVVHNHPSGSLIPSDEDKEVTERIAGCGRLLGIKLIDSIIVTSMNGRTEHLSLASNMPELFERRTQGRNYSFGEKARTYKSKPKEKGRTR